MKAIAKEVISLNKGLVHRINSWFSKLRNDTQSVRTHGLRGQLVEQFRTLFLMTLLSFWAASLSKKGVTAGQSSPLWVPVLMFLLGTVAILILGRSKAKKKGLSCPLKVLGVSFMAVLAWLSYYLDRHSLPYLLLFGLGVVLLLWTLLQVGLLVMCGFLPGSQETLAKYVIWVAPLFVPMASVVFLVGVLATWGDIRQTVQGGWVQLLLYVGIALCFVNVLVGCWAIEPPTTTQPAPSTAETNSD